MTTTTRSLWTAATASASNGSSSSSSSSSKLVAVIHDASIGHSRLSVPLYALSNNNNRNVNGEEQCDLWQLQSTLTCALPTAHDKHKSIRKLLFASPNHLVVLFSNGDDSNKDTDAAAVLVVWNVTRGVVVHTISIIGGEKEGGLNHGTSSSNMMVHDIASVMNTSSTTSSSSSSSSDESIYVLTSHDKHKKRSKSNKLYIHQYSLVTGKLVRKIKSGLSSSVAPSSSSSSSLVASNEYLVVRHDDKVRILSSHTGSKLAKLSVPNSGGGDISTTTSNSMMAICTSSNVLAIVGEGVVLLYSLDNLVQHQSGDSKDQQQRCLLLGQISQQQAVDSIVLSNSTMVRRILINFAAEATESAEAAVYQWQLQEGLSTTKEGEQSLHITKANQTITTSPLVETAHCLLVSNGGDRDEDTDLLVAVLHSKTHGVHVVSQTLSNEDDDDDDKEEPESSSIICLDVPSPDNEHHQDQQKGSSLKRSIMNVQSVTTTLGPGQAGGEALHASDRPIKRAKTTTTEGTSTTAIDDDPQDLTIAERLEKLAQEMNRQEEEDEEDDNDDAGGSPTTTTTAATIKSAFQSKKATTESLSNLLKQALTSGDDAMLELSLGVRDKRVIGTSLQQLEDDSLVELLLTKLTTRLSNKPTRASELSVWISHVLESGKIRDVQQLRPLRNLLQERVESLPHLLKLEGRLSVLASMK